VSANKNEAKLTLRHVPDQPGVAAKIFSALAAAHINVDVIVQNTSEAGTTDLSFTVGRTDRVTAEEIIRNVARDIRAKGVEVDDSIAKVSIVGVGMRAHPGVAAAMFEALAAAKVNIQMITTSEIKVTCVIGRDDSDRAMQALHAQFELDKAPVAKVPAKAPVKSKAKPHKKAKRR
jgi:aspartate kinase